jgi:hypothetical protein
MRTPWGFEPTISRECAMAQFAASLVAGRSALARRARGSLVLEDTLPLMDYQAITTAVTAWLAALAEAHPEFEWATKTGIEAYPAFLLPHNDPEQRRQLQSIAALPVRLTQPASPDEGAVARIRAWILDDPTLGGRVGHTIFEPGDGSGTICTLVVTPRNR